MDTRFVLEKTIDSDIESVYRIRYRALRSINAIPLCESEICKDEFDDKPHAVTYSLKNDTTLIGTIRPVVREPRLGWNDIPVTVTNRETLFQQLPEDATYIEVSRFAVDPDYSEKYARAGIILLRAIIANAIYYDCDYIIAVINQRHLSFYSRFMKCDVLAELEYCYGVNISGHLVYLDVKNKMKCLLNDVSMLKMSDDDIERLRI